MKIMLIEWSCINIKREITLLYCGLISKHCHVITYCTDLGVTGAVADHR